MYQAELVEYVIKVFSNLGYDDARNMLQIVFITMRNAFLLGESVNIPGVGKLYPDFCEDFVKLKFIPSKSFEKELTDKLVGQYDEFVKKTKK
jgi:hypothetical protein